MNNQEIKKALHSILSEFQRELIDERKFAKCIWELVDQDEGEPNAPVSHFLEDINEELGYWEDDPRIRRNEPGLFGNEELRSKATEWLKRIEEI